MTEEQEKNILDLAKKVADPKWFSWAAIDLGDSGKISIVKTDYLMKLETRWESRLVNLAKTSMEAIKEIQDNVKAIYTHIDEYDKARKV